MITLADLQTRVSLDNQIITMRQIAEYGGCISGWRTFCKLNNLSWSAAVRHGVYAEELLATGDAMAEDLVRFVYTGERIL